MHASPKFTRKRPAKLTTDGQFELHSKNCEESDMNWPLSHGLFAADAVWRTPRLYPSMHDAGEWDLHQTPVWVLTGYRPPCLHGQLRRPLDQGR
jgi:hypothetical protein